ncbi:MAG: adenylate/guanylate cyclase domain-containing protein [Pseudomonadota bacterium]
MANNSSNLAIVFADINGSTRLHEILGDAAARAKVAGCLELLSDVVGRYDGTVIKTIGDEIMCTFPSAEAAANSACEMQEVMDDEVTEHTDSGPVSLTLRVGFHFGPAIHENNDVFGDAVNVAARMASMAKSGQIITTQETVDELSGIMKASSRFIDRAPVKGKKETMDICEILWQQEDITRMSTGAVNDSEQESAKLTLSYQDEILTVDENRTQVVLGRSKTTDLAVNESLASRQHVKIERRRGKFFIVDQSTNGTYISQDGAFSFLRREEMPLGENGEISLGRSFKDQPKDVVRFETEL